MSKLETLISAVASKIVDLSADKREALSRSLDMSADEFQVFQEAKSLASSIGRISLDVAMELYGLLGNTVSTFNSRDLATKIVLTRVFADLAN